MRPLRALAAVVLLLAGVRPGHAQPTPLGPGFRVNTTAEGLQSEPAVAADSAGRFAVVWTDQCARDPDSRFPCEDPGQDGDGAGVFGRWFDAAGQPASGQVQLHTVTAGRQARPDVAVGADGRFFVVWSSDRRIVGRLFDAAGTPLTAEVAVSAPESGVYDAVPAVAAVPSGGFVVAWQRSQELAYAREVRVRRLDADGQPLGGDSRVDGGELGIREGPEVAVQDDGSFAVAWSTAPLATNADEWTVRARLFHPSGEPNGSSLRLDVPGKSQYPNAPSVSPLAGSGFLVGWDAAERSENEIFVRAVSADRKLGEVVRLSLTPFNSGVVLARHADGGLLALWTRLEVASLAGLAGRRLDARGTPFGPQFPVEIDAQWSTYQPDVAATPTGFVAAWTAGPSEAVPGPDGEGSAVFVRRFVVSPPGADLCAFGPGGFRCDLLRDGGAELAIPFGEPSDLPLLGDLDGDGRDDPCVVRAGRFLCDTDHDGAADLDLAFGPGAPLLGDVNGDGRDDACVHAGRRFLCDTAHDGGTAELIVAFGRAAGDVPLLGDLDGDGDDEPCVHRGAQLLCDPVHDGGAAELVLAFGGGGIPLLGDVDADGRDDHCLALDGRLRCDTAHDGGGAELEIPYDPAGGAPLLGNVDGY